MQKQAKTETITASLILISSNLSEFFDQWTNSCLPEQSHFSCGTESTTLRQYVFVQTYFSLLGRSDSQYIWHQLVLLKFLFYRHCPALVCVHQHSWDAQVFDQAACTDTANYAMLYNLTLMRGWVYHGRRPRRCGPKSSCKNSSTQSVYSYLLRINPECYKFIHGTATRHGQPQFGCYYRIIISDVGKTFWLGGTVKTTHRVVRNLYNNSWKLGGAHAPSACKPDYCLVPSKFNISCGLF